MQFKNRKVCNESSKKVTINPVPIVGDFLYTSLIKLSHLRGKQFLRFGSSSELSAADPPSGGFHPNLRTEQRLLPSGRVQDLHHNPERSFRSGLPCQDTSPVSPSLRGSFYGAAFPGKGILTLQTAAPTSPETYGMLQESSRC